MGPFQRKVHCNRTVVIVNQRKDICINERKRIFIHYFVKKKQDASTNRTITVENAMVYNAVDDPGGFFVRVIRTSKFDPAIKRFLKRVLPFNASQNDFFIVLKSLVSNMPIKARNSALRAGVELWKEANPISSFPDKNSINTNKLCQYIDGESRRRRKLQRKQHNNE